MKAGLEKEKAALRVAVGALSDGNKVILAVKAGHRESTESGSRLLRVLKPLIRRLHRGQLVGQGQFHLACGLRVCAAGRHGTGQIEQGQQRHGIRCGLPKPAA